MNLNWPLMQNNITRADLDAVIDYLRQDNPPLTQAGQVVRFEEEWSRWLGVKHSVFVNSGSSANQVTMAALHRMHGPGEVIVPTLTWVSDIAAVLQNDLTPVFVDIDPRTLGMDCRQIISKLSAKTRAVFITHILGYNALTRELVDELARRKIPLIEDACESHGATFEGRKVGSIGWASNFSFYYAHHMSTIEGGMVCTDDPDLYEMIRMYRSHGLVRESRSAELRQSYQARHPDLNPEFIFAFPAYNVRSTEINAILGLSQLKRLDAHNELRRRNLELFLKSLDPDRYQTDFATQGSCNYAFTLILKKADDGLCGKVMQTLKEHGVEFRRGTSGGGNQLRQPYLKEYFAASPVDLKAFPKVDHVHFFGFYLGNYPELDVSKIDVLCRALNGLQGSD
jgi:CDP-6-deoxy-D-xylo-4-hexulose-3-dehydrase